MTSMAERPAEGATRTVPGHWEGDLIKRARNGSAVGPLVERTTRLVMLARMEGTDATSARQGFIKKLRHVPALLREDPDIRSGQREGRACAPGSAAGDPDLLCRPVQPVATRHQRKHQRVAAPVLAEGHDLSGYTQRELHAIAHRLNTRPRKCLNFATPLEVYTHLRHHSPVALGT